MRAALIGGIALAALVVPTWEIASAVTMNKTVNISGRERFVANQVISNTFHFTPGPISVPSGGTITWVNRTEDGHTITLMNQADVPDEFDEAFFECQDPGGPCEPFLNNPEQQVGSSGLDQVGDSALVPGDGSLTQTVSAPSGSTLYYICVFHPWMQGTIRVT